MSDLPEVHWTFLSELPCLVATQKTTHLNLVFIIVLFFFILCTHQDAFLNNIFLSFACF